MERKKAMAAYKDEKTGTYYVKFYYTDWNGKKKQKLKRGFTRKKDAQSWERLFLEELARVPILLLKHFTGSISYSKRIECDPLH